MVDLLVLPGGRPLLATGFDAAFELDLDLAAALGLGVRLSGSSSCVWARSGFLGLVGAEVTAVFAGRPLFLGAAASTKTVSAFAGRPRFLGGSSCGSSSPLLRFDDVGAATTGAASVFLGLPRVAFVGVGTAVALGEALLITAAFGGLPRRFGVSATGSSEALEPGTPWKDLACFLGDPLGAREGVNL